MSYRTFKHLLGETSLERKCRFIFGGGIFMLVAFSFAWYGQKAETLVREQMIGAASPGVRQAMDWLHAKRYLRDGSEPIVDEVSAATAKLARNHGDVPYIIEDPRVHERDEARPRDAFEADALSRFLQAAARSASAPSPPAARKDFTFPDGTPTERFQADLARSQYQYVQAVLFEQKCMRCHADMLRKGANGKFAYPREDDLAVAVAVRLPMDRAKINLSRALLISTALVTAILAMVVAYAIVRYVIVKPVKHLRDVSDAIAAGRLNIRSQIHTGDEFEELSHAFNRMLHNLVAMQQELREVNADLDKKVDELAQANMALFEMNRIKSDFLATMSHELRTPLNSIIGFSEVLSTSKDTSEKQRRYAQNIQSSGKMLLGMINDILDLAKIESGKMECHLEDFSIRDVCEGLVALMKPVADRKDIDLECRLDDALPLLHQDPGKLRQIIYNLLSNAIKFTPESGRVVLRAQTEGRFVVIEVEDTGIGIAEEDRERIFEKFRQVHATKSAGGVLTREHEGTGLGLSIVRELTRLLGGDVSLESQVGRGSTFTIRVPAQLAASRKFEVTLADEAIDLTKARRVETRSPSPPLPIGNGLRRSVTEDSNLAGMPRSS